METIHARFRLIRPGFTLDVDLVLPCRGVTALFGSSGTGKTTLLRCIAGLERAPHGLLTVNGTAWQDDQNWLPTHRRPVGYVFQEASLFPHLSVRGNLLYGQRRASGGREAGKISLDAILEVLEIRSLFSRRSVVGLSGGERQRVALARALLSGPELLLLDEPLASLDTGLKERILPYLRLVRDEFRVPMLLVTHSPSEVMALCDEAVILEAGRLVGQGKPAELFVETTEPVWVRRTEK